MTRVMLTNTLQAVQRPGEGFFPPSFRILENKGICIPGGIQICGEGVSELETDAPCCEDTVLLLCRVMGDVFLLL